MAVLSPGFAAFSPSHTFGQSHFHTHVPGLDTPRTQTLQSVTRSRRRRSRGRKPKKPDFDVRLFKKEWLELGSADRTLAFQAFFREHTKGGDAYEERQKKPVEEKGEEKESPPWAASPYRVTFAQISKFVRDNIALSEIPDLEDYNLQEETVRIRLKIAKVVPKHCKKIEDRVEFHQLESFACARALMLVNHGAALDEFIAMLRARDDTIVALTKLFPQERRGGEYKTAANSKAAANLMYVKGFLANDFLSDGLERCVAPLCGTLKDLPAPPADAKEPEHIPDGVDVSNAETLYHYLVDGYLAKKTGVTYINRHCRYRALVVANGKKDTDVGKGCALVAEELRSSLERVCFEVTVLEHFDAAQIKTELQKEVDMVSSRRKYDGFLLYFVGHGLKGRIMAEDELLKSQILINMLKPIKDLPRMVIVDACQVPGKPAEQGYIVDAKTDHLFLAQGASQDKFGRTIYAAYDAEKKQAKPVFTTCFARELHSLNKCDELKDILQRTAARANEVYKQYGHSEMQPVIRSTTKQLFWFPRSIVN